MSLHWMTLLAEIVNVKGPPASPGGGRYTLHLPRLSALVPAELPRNLTVIASPGDAIPHRCTGSPRCSTICSEKTLDTVTSALSPATVVVSTLTTIMVAR